MASQKVLVVSFMSCCKKALKNIKDVQEMGKVLKTMVKISPFLILLGSHPADQALSLSTQDWDIWGKAVKNVSKMTRIKCQQIAELERLNHPGGSLGTFWKNMCDSFDAKQSHQ